MPVPRRCSSSRTSTSASATLEVLSGIDLEVPAGEVVCVIGPSGSGKSTLLRCVNLLEPPEDGEIFLEGHDICKGPGSGTGEQSWELDFVRQRVGMVFQQFNLFPHLTALDNVTLAPSKVLGMPRGRGARAGARAARTGRPRRQARRSTRSGSRAASSSGWPSPGRWRWTRT